MEYANSPYEAGGGQLSQATVSAYMTRVFGWMTLALAITAVTSLFVASTPAFVNLFLANKFVFYGLLIGELLLVGALAGLVAGLALPVLSPQNRGRPATPGRHHPRERRYPAHGSAPRSPARPAAEADHTARPR